MTYLYLHTTYNVRKEQNGSVLDWRVPEGRVYWWVPGERNASTIWDKEHTHTHIYICIQTGKTSPIRRKAAWGHHWDSIERPSKNPLTIRIHNTIVLRGWSRVLNLAPIMPRDASLWDSECIVSRHTFLRLIYLLQFVHLWKFIM